MSDPTFYDVRITGENGVRPTGNIEGKRTSRFFVRASSEYGAISQVTQWILHKLGDRAPELLRYIDVGAHFHDEQVDPRMFKSMGLEHFDPEDWLCFIPNSHRRIPITALHWEGDDLHMATEDGNMVLKGAYVSGITYNNEHEEYGGVLKSTRVELDFKRPVMEKLDLDVKFTRDVPMAAFTETKKDTPVEVLQHSLPRLPDGTINNCSLNNGADEATCQMCNGTCPDKHKFVTHPAPGVAVETPAHLNFESPRYTPYGSHE